MTLMKGPWQLSQLKDIPSNGRKVFSCFSCGGGSTMGYKLAGFEMLGCCEIDPRMFSVYVKNHAPRYPFNQAIQDFKKTCPFPSELLDLDILDGSPPCSSFSMAGSREKAWGKEKKFREGQAEQVLDDLFFHFIDLAKALQPKVVIAENVSGLIKGAARGYVKLIFKAFDDAGYNTQLFLLNAASMGVPQTRERTFFIARRKDLNFQKINLVFNEPPIVLATALEGANNAGKKLGTAMAKRWRETKMGSHPKTTSGNTFGFLYRAHPEHVCATVIASPRISHWEDPRLLSPHEITRVQTFPEDYNFLDADPTYICGMSVPPFMMQRIANQIYLQWFRKEQTA